MCKSHATVEVGIQLVHSGLKALSASLKFAVLHPHLALIIKDGVRNTHVSEFLMAFASTVCSVFSMDASNWNTKKTEVNPSLEDHCIILIIPMIISPN